MDKQIHPSAAPVSRVAPLDFELAADVFADTEALALELERRAERTGAETAYWMREAAVHLRGLHALMLQAVDRAGQAAQPAVALPSDKPDRLLRMREVIPMLGIRPSSFYTWVQEGKFPPGIRTGPRTVCWPESVVQAWIRAQAASAYTS